MRRLSILSLVLALIALALVATPPRAAAQDDPNATPAAHAARESRGVPAEQCQVAPRSADEVLALLGMTEGGAGATPARQPSPRRR
jgi:hypothetical protein